MFKVAVRQRIWWTTKAKLPHNMADRYTLTPQRIWRKNMMESDNGKVFFIVNPATLLRQNDFLSRLSDSVGFLRY